MNLKGLKLFIKFYDYGKQKKAFEELSYFCYFLKYKGSANGDSFQTSFSISI